MTRLTATECHTPVRAKLFHSVMVLAFGVVVLAGPQIAVL